MERRALGVLAIILIGLMAIVATAGLDNLPASLKKSVDAANGLLLKDKRAFEEDWHEVERYLSDEPALFQAEAASWRSRLDHDRGQLDAAAAKLISVQQLAKANRRTDDYYVERGLNEFNFLRQDALRDATGVRSEAERRLASKRALPARLQAMRASDDALQRIDAEDSIQSVRKAMGDWPAKREDLQTRLDRLKNLKDQGQKIWESSAGLRSAAEANRLADSDLDALLSQADQLDAVVHQARESLAEDNALASQLYTSFDKLLLDVEHGGAPRQKVRIVRTRFPDATLAHGQTTSEERWETLDTFRARDSDESSGVVIERKSAGEYDSEAERSVQPPAYAYIAPPGQANAYGSWSGGVWHWLPEYLFLSQLLHASRRTITAPDFDAYQHARSRGEVFYGRNREYSGPRPSGGSSAPGFGRLTPFEPPASRTLSPGGYASSRYRSRGTFSGSQYRSRGTFGSSGFGASGGAARSYSRSRGGRR